MRRSATLLLAWTAAAAVALAVAWQGVAIVGRQLTEDRPDPLSAAEINEALEQGDGGADSTATSTPGPTSTSTPSGAGGESPPGEDRNYRLEGGTVALRFSAGEVTVLWANPNAGFDVETEPEGTGIKVEFESEGHRSRVDGWWDGGPRDRVREEPR